MWHDWGMLIHGQHFSGDIIVRIQKTIQASPSISRNDLSRRVCEWLNWRSPNGRLKEISARKALAELNLRGSVVLPPQDKTFAFQKPSTSKIEFDIAELNCELSDLGAVQ